MDSKHRFASISSDSVASILEAYPPTVSSKLANLDTSRYDNIPSIIDVRKPSGDVYLTKKELVELVDWKLSHGTFRPTLKALVNQNTEETIKSTTRDAYSTFDASSSDSVKKSLNTLTKLKGIGPATASLALSVYEPGKAPFFSDELFRWVFWEEGKGKGWDRQIKYSLKEYLEMYEKSRTRLEEESGLRAVDLEKAAYVLGHKVGKKGDDGNTNSKPNGVAQIKEAVRSENKTKRKAEEQGTEEQPPKKSKGTADERNKISKSSKPAREQKPGTRSSARLKET